MFDVVATLAGVDEATAGRSHQDLVWIGTVVPSFPPSHLGTPPDHWCRCSAAERVSHLRSSEPAARVGDGAPRHRIGEEVLDRILVSTATPRCRPRQVAAQAGGRPLPRLAPADPPPLVASPEPRGQGLGLAQPLASLLCRGITESSKQIALLIRRSGLGKVKGTRPLGR
jgi:hypothetical protein